MHPCTHADTCTATICPRTSTHPHTHSRTRARCVSPLAQRGTGEGDDETITIQFQKLDPSITTMFMFCTVFEGGKLGECENLHVRMTTLKGKQKVWNATRRLVPEFTLGCKLECPCY